MATSSLDARQNNLQISKSQGVVVEQIEGLIRSYRDGHVERPPIVPIVSSAVAPDLLVAGDVIINKLTNLWARIYAPNRSPGNQKPLLIYFHGGGFCVGSAAWSCYHYFLSNLASRAGCVIVSVNYRLAPENRLPAAYEDGLNAMAWVSQQAQAALPEQSWWLSRSNLSRVFLAGDSAGANIAYNVALRAGSGSSFKPMSVKGAILIQPFFGGEARTESEKYSTQPANSALTLSASDTFWRLALPVGTSRDQPWCNPLSAKPASFGLPAVMVCVSEMDILKDRNVEFCNAMTSLGKRVEKVVYRDVGHAFHVLHNSPLSELRTGEMMSHLSAFINQ